MYAYKYKFLSFHTGRRRRPTSSYLEILSFATYILYEQ